MASVPRLSILIPWLGLPQQFEGTLVSVLQNRPADCEVVLAHVPEYDDPYGLGDELRLIHAPQQRSVIGLINEALPQLQGEIIHLLGCGIEVTEHWTAPALAHFHDPEVAAVSPLVQTAAGSQAGVALTSDGRRRVILADSTSDIASLEAQISGPTLDAGFYHRDVLLALEGFDEHVGDAYADLDLGLAISDLGLRTVVEPSLPLALSESGSQRLRGLSAGAAAERFYRRHAARCSSGSATRLLWALASDAAYLPTLEAFTRPLGRLLAWFETDPSQRHADRVAAAATTLEQVAAQTFSLDAAREQQSANRGDAQRRAA